MKLTNSALFHPQAERFVIKLILGLSFATSAFGLAVGNRVSANATSVNVRSTAAGSVAGTQSLGSLGTIIGGPTTASLSGTSYSWFNVNFDSGTDGWVASIALDQAPASVTKPATPTNPSPGTTSSPGPVQSGSTVNLTWSASTGATYYELGVVDVATGTLVVDTTTTSATYTATLAAGKTYRWNVAAGNTAGLSSYTTVVYFQTPAAVAKPATPTNPSPGTTSSPGPVQSGSTVTLTWSASTGATYYELGVVDVATGTLVVDTTTTSATYTATLAAGKTYRWNVAAGNTAGLSSYTAVVYFQISPGSAFSVPIIEDFIPIGRVNRPGYSLVASYITIHDTDNPDAGADAAMHGRYVKGDIAAGIPASWHLTVDDREIYQHLPLNEVGWHAGDGLNGTGNRQSIGIEVCMNSDGNRTQAEENAAWLTAKLLIDNNLPVSAVRQHHDWSGKNCPSVLRGRTGGWDGFIARVSYYTSLPVTPDNFPGWQTANFTSAELASETISGVSADPDGDGLTNLQEYAFFLDPRTTSTSPVTVGTTTDAGSTYLTLTYTRIQGASDLTFAAQFTGDLTTWSSSSVTISTTDNENGSETLVLRDTVPLATRRFGRIQVTK